MIFFRLAIYTLYQMLYQNMAKRTCATKNQNFFAFKNFAEHPILQYPIYNLLSPAASPPMEVEHNL